MSIDNDALQLLCDRVEGNLLAAHQEIQKLGLLFPVAPGNEGARCALNKWRVPC